jgi:hypothetical protein
MLVTSSLETDGVNIYIKWSTVGIGLILRLSVFNLASNMSVKCMGSVVWSHIPDFWHDHQFSGLCRWHVMPMAERSQWTSVSF